MFFSFRRQHTLFLTTQALQMLCDNLSRKKKMVLTCRRNNVLQALFLLFLFKYFLEFQKKINKIQEIEIPPESMGFLLEESGCQQPPATGTARIRMARLALQIGQTCTIFVPRATQILPRIFNQNSARAWPYESIQGTHILPKHLYSEIYNTIPFLVSGTQEWRWTCYSKSTY